MTQAYLNNKLNRRHLSLRLRKFNFQENCHNAFSDVLAHPMFKKLLCRKLYLDQAEDFLRLGGSALQSLSLSMSGASLSNSQVWTLASFTALTSLELCDLVWMASSTPLKDLPLKVLILIDCQPVVSHFIVPELFPYLTKLHIEEAIPHRHITLKFRLKMRSLGSILLDMPSLSQISGNSRIFTVGMKYSLSTWHCEPFSQEALETHARRRAIEGLKMWGRPRQ